MMVANLYLVEEDKVLREDFNNSQQEKLKIKGIEHTLSFAYMVSRPRVYRQDYKEHSR